MPTNKIVVIPEGVDIEVFTFNRNTSEFKTENNLSNKFIILMVGRMSKIKGIDYLLKAADILVNKWGYTDVLFIIIGPVSSIQLGKDRPLDVRQSLRFVNDHGLSDNVKFTGVVSREKLLLFYSACDVFVLPSLAELFPMVITEAMASGKPIIATSVGAVKEQVHDTWNGFLIAPRNERQIAEKIKFMIDNPEERKSMGFNSRSYVEKNFDYKIIANKFSQIQY